MFAYAGRPCAVTLPVAGFSLARLSMVCAAALSAGCSASGPGRMPDGPSWSLADKPPVALGGMGASTQTATPAGPTYEYRGGRDPVTGRAGPVPSPVPAARPQATGVPGEGPRAVEIRKGDTLHGLSLTYHDSVKALMEANNLTSTTIIPGHKLVIPQS